MHKFRCVPILISLVVCCVLPMGWATTAEAASKASDVAEGKDVVIVTVKSEESLQSLAQQYLGSIDRAWQIADFNGIEKARPGQRLVIPLAPVRPGGIEKNGYQLVPVLYYPRIAAKRSNAKVVDTILFAKQLQYLKDNGFKTISLDQLYAFLNFKAQLPPKAVVITFDTTQRWLYDIAYPILLRHNLSAAVFIRTDRIGQTGHLTWEEVKKLAAAGFDIGTNGSSAKKLTRIEKGTDAETHLQTLEAEISTPREVIRNKTGRSCRYFAYPSGASDDMVVALLKRHGYHAAFTLDPGSNPFFVDNFRIKRSLVRKDTDFKKFHEHLATFSSADLR